MTVGYFLVDSDLFALNEAGRTQYLGIDRSPWRCVDERYYAGELPNDLSVLRKKSFDNLVGTLSFGVMNSKHEVERLAEACDKSDVRRLQVLAVESLGPVADAPKTYFGNSCEAGLDAVADGFGSLINLGIVQHPHIFNAFLEKLNRFGLFTSMHDLQSYVANYMQVSPTANLEIIEDPAQVFVYRIVEIFDLEKA